MVVKERIRLTLFSQILIGIIFAVSVIILSCNESTVKTCEKYYVTKQDSCEYLTRKNESGNVEIVAHYGECKYCEKQRRKEMREEYLKLLEGKRPNK